MLQAAETDKAQKVVEQTHFRVKKEYEHDADDRCRKHGRAVQNQAKEAALFLRKAQNQNSKNQSQHHAAEGGGKGIENGVPEGSARKRILQDAQIVVKTCRFRLSKAIPFLKGQHEIPKKRDHAEQRHKQDSRNEIEDAGPHGPLFHLHIAVSPLAWYRKRECRLPAVRRHSLFVWLISRRFPQS